MCGTINDASAQSCSFCGYLFEDYGTGTVNPPKTSQSQVAENQFNTSSQDQEPTSIPSVSTSANPGISSETAVFVVSRSILSTIVPSLAYLLFIGFVGLSSGFSLYTILLIGFFLVVALVPALLAPRRFEFYDDSLKIHKTIGGDSEIPYSELSLVEYSPRARGQQIVLSATGRRRPIVIPKNPTNQGLNMDLKQFLTGKLKKAPAPGSKESASPTNQQGTENENPDTTSTI